MRPRKSYVGFPRYRACEIYSFYSLEDGPRAAASSNGLTRNGARFPTPVRLSSKGHILAVQNPYYKDPNQSLRNKDDWHVRDIEDVDSAELPVTVFKPVGNTPEYGAGYTHWELDGARTPARSQFRVAWRRRAANEGERTLFSAIIPPGFAHVEQVNSIATREGLSETVLVAAFLGSLVADFLIRIAPKDDLRLSAIERLPYFVRESSSSSLGCARFG